MSLRLIKASRRGLLSCYGHVPFLELTDNPLITEAVNTGSYELSRSSLCVWRTGMSSR